ncbi:MAG: adenosine-specific kinase [Candidatus Methanofastidiosa archaeon]|nr:adenosine-specific kinase [Candidatus Methanofastidiosa archaeon]
MNFEIIDIEKDAGIECIIGQGNFSIFTVEDLAVKLKTTTPSIEFGIAMNEAKPRLVRAEGNEEKLRGAASRACLDIGAGHVFVIMMRNAFPINVLNAVKSYPGVCGVYGASENPLQVLVAVTDLGRSVIGIVDGTAADSIETEEQRSERRDLLGKIGYRI